MMQSSVAVALRISVLVGCLVYLPLMAAGGLSVPDRVYAEARAWIGRHTSDEPLLAQRTIQLELPAEALRYREVGSPVEPAWDELPDELDTAEVMPANYEEIISPSDREEIGFGPQQPWTPPSADPSFRAAERSSDPGDPTLTAPSQPLSNRMTDHQEIFESGERSDLPSRPTLADTEDQLRRLGAIDLQLEPWGNTGQFYRYCASVPMAGSPEVQRLFQSIGPSPDQAALEVLAQAVAARQE